MTGHCFRFSIVISTVDRVTIVKRLLESVAKLREIDPETFEIIIVDNSSSGAVHDGLLELIGAHDLTIQCVKQARRGLSVARNTGAEHASGKYLVFLDDDVEVDPYWLAAYDSATRIAADLVTAGGRIRVQWPTRQPPQWLPPRYWWLYGYLDYGTMTQRLGRGEMLNGGNFLIRRDVFRDYGGFDEKLGHRKGKLGGSEEQDLLRQVQSDHKSVFYVGGALVHHIIPIERMSEEWALSRLSAAAQDRGFADFSKHRGIKTYFRLLYYGSMLPWIARGKYRSFRREECKAYMEGYKGVLDS